MPNSVDFVYFFGNYYWIVFGQFCLRFLMVIKCTVMIVHMF